MKIKLLSNVFGARSAKKGDEVEWPDAECQKLIALGFAQPVKDAAPLETATISEPLETTTKA